MRGHQPWAGGLVLVGATLVLSPAPGAAPGPPCQWEVTIRPVAGGDGAGPETRVKVTGRVVLREVAGDAARPRAFRLEGVFEDGRGGGPRLRPVSALEPRLMVRRRGRLVAVPVTDVARLEAEGDYVRAHTDTTSHLIDGPLAELERTLSPLGFVRVHRQHLVNLGRVDHLESLGSGRYRLHLAGGHDVPVSRRHSPRFRQRLA